MKKHDLEIIETIAGKAICGVGICFHWNGMDYVVSAKDVTSLRCLWTQLSMGEPIDSTRLRDTATVKRSTLEQLTAKD